MVTCNRSAKRLMIIASPNQSATWRSNQLVLLALAIPSLGAATAFALLGAWPILPLAGLELMALGYALYYVNIKLRVRQVITVSADSIQIDKGDSAPRQSWRLPRGSTALSVTPQTHPWEGPSLALYDRHENITLGEFLSREDSLKLQALLQEEIRVRTNGTLGRRDF